MQKRRHNTVAGFCVVMGFMALLLIDQAVKLWVKTHMHLGESYCVTPWFYINFIENNGMAYGMSFLNKVVLTLFRIAAVTAIAIYIYKVLSQHFKPGYLICLTLIMAGAAGNIVDCIFYGMCFTPSTTYYVSEFTTFGCGYAPLLQGKVVDMFYFPIIDTNWPEWVPYFGGDRFIFFSPVFNFADSCISVGVVALILFYRKEMESIGTTLFQKSKSKEQ